MPGEAVPLEVALPVAAHRAKGALEGPLPCVGEEVPLEFGRSEELLPADGGVGAGCGDFALRSGVRAVG